MSTHHEDDTAKKVQTACNYLGPRCGICGERLKVRVKVDPSAFDFRVEAGCCNRGKTITFEAKDLDSPTLFREKLTSAAPEWFHDWSGIDRTVADRRLAQKPLMDQIDRTGQICIFCAQAFTVEPISGAQRECDARRGHIFVRVKSVSTGRVTVGGKKYFPTKVAQNEAIRILEGRRMSVRLQTIDDVERITYLLGTQLWAPAWCRGDSRASRRLAERIMAEKKEDLARMIMADHYAPNWLREREAAMRMVNDILKAGQVKADRWPLKIDRAGVSKAHDALGNMDPHEIRVAFHGPLLNPRQALTALGVLPEPSQALTAQECTHTLSADPVAVAERRHEIMQKGDGGTESPCPCEPCQARRAQRIRTRLADREQARSAPQPAAHWGGEQFACEGDPD